MRTVNMLKFEKELREASIPIHGVRGDGTVDFTDDATPEQQAQAQAILEAHDPGMILDALKNAGYTELMAVIND
jgi:hypothetical protein